MLITVESSHGVACAQDSIRHIGIQMIKHTERLDLNMHIAGSNAASAFRALSHSRVATVR